MRSFRLSRDGLLIAAYLLMAVPAGAVTVKIDYSHDTGNFFAGGNPQGAAAGAQARAALEAAATYYSNILTDTLAAIVPPTYSSPRVNMVWTWTMGFTHPSDAFTVQLVDQTIPADEYRIFAGARLHAGDTLAVGGPGYVPSWGRNGIPGSANSTDIMQIQMIDAAFDDALTDRGETSGFAAWGGSLSFDRDTAWHYNHTMAPVAGKTDLYTVAVHELAHTLGFGASTTWTNLVGGSNFTGAASMARYGGPVPLGPGNGHWQEGIMSTVFDGGASQTTIMTPSLPPGVRRRLTNLDAAGLTDIGWSVIPPPSLPGDYNKNGLVDAADYIVWRNTRGQSVTPGSGADGSGNGSVGSEDYSYWRARFGMASASGSGIVASVPEPAGGPILAAVGLFAAGCRPTRIFRGSARR